MREAASRGFFLGSKAPFGYKRVKVNDGAKERPTLEVDPTAAPIVKGIFESSLRSNGLKEICRELNDRGITNRGRRWYKGGLHYLLTNEAYTGTAVWGRTAKGEQAPEPVRVAKAWKPLVSRRLFESVQQALHERAPVAQRPARVGSKFLLSGLLRCGVCGRPYIGQGAKSGQYGYYICGTLYREGAGTCEARYLNAPRVEGFIIDKIKERILTDGTITELVTLVAEEIDAMAGEMNGRLKVIWAELADVESRLENLYEALETKQLTMDALSPRILSLRHRQDQLTAARQEAASLLEQRRVDLPGTEEIKGYVADFREFLQEGTFPERKALIRNFVKGIEVTGDEAVLTYTIPMPSDGVTKESASVLDFVQSGPPDCTVLRTRPFRGHLCGVRSTYRRVLRRGDGVDDGGLAGLDLDLLDERVDEGPGLGKLAGLEELAHLGGEGGDGVGAVQELPPLREQLSRLLCGDLQLLLALPVLLDGLCSKSPVCSKSRGSVPKVHFSQESSNRATV